MENLKLMSIIKLMGNPTTMILLKNKKDFAISTENGFLFIYNIKLLKQKLCKKILNKTILDIIELEENKICISCYDFQLRIIELHKNNRSCNIVQTITEHKDYINALKKLNYYQNQFVFASGSNDRKIILWKLENNIVNKFQEIECLHVEDNAEIQIEGLEESTKYHQLICSYSLNETIFFCNLDNIQEIVPLNMKVNRCIRALKIIENGEILIVGGNQEINVVDVENKTILISIKYGIKLEFNCVFQKKDGNLLITEYDKQNETKLKEFK